ncbi:CHAD domain-containing protein [Marinobacter sp. JSM 1782161]|uniref:CHAD domain-containing protein n=1 Tax=Marinobacter sp. JSM 1782161 TaxID=2685906 RepID=UPI001401EFA2|nr:CHAD domain-containing protein [Marinobacter sp. JSM 1782161]
MKHLFLIRHGKSSWSDAALEDWERPLNKRGQRQLGLMAGALRRIGAFNGVIYASNAMRARQTIEGMIASLNDDRLPPRVHFKSRLYTFSADTLWKWLLKRDEDRVTLVGHNPALEELANRLLRKPVDALPTGSGVHILLPIQHWSELEPDTGALGEHLKPGWVSYHEFQRKQPGDPGKKQGGSALRGMALSLQHLMARLQALEPGTALGFDPEFLHQYRISIRKVRAVLETLYALSGDKALKPSVKRLKRHARATSDLRDLDVFMDTLADWERDPDYRDALADTGALAAFRERQQAAQTGFAGHIQTRVYLDDMESLREFMHSATLEKTLKQQNKHLIREVLDARIADHNARLVALSDLSADEDFHRLRKNLKRIRYLADLDRALPSDFRKDLKQRQSILGEFQDRHVQETFMQAYQRDSDPDGRLTPLIQRLTGQKQAARQHILTLDPIDPPEPVTRARKTRPAPEGA